MRIEKRSSNAQENRKAVAELQRRGRNKKQEARSKKMKERSIGEEITYQQWRRERIRGQ
ncbi:UNVERIFIED_CONTAM: hypothetical protein Sindi_2891300, partial [Sesamum indicum]